MIQGTEIHAIQIVFLMSLLFVVMFAALARKLQTPYPIVLVVAGLVLSFIPGIPRIALNPDVIFLVVLPPLLYSAAWLTSWREFKFNLVSILSLAFGLVGFTVLGVAKTASWAFPGFDSGGWAFYWGRLWRQRMQLPPLRSPKGLVCRSVL
jgi:NhaP-type Na+/H+ or K+/H+ antiporter